MQEKGFRKRKRSLPKDSEGPQAPAQRRKLKKTQTSSSKAISIRATLKVHQVVATMSSILSYQQSGQLRGRYSSFCDDNPMHTGHGVRRGGENSGGVDLQAVQWYCDSAQDRSKKTAKQKRAECWRKYTVCEAVKQLIDSKKFVFFNQGQSGGCVFAALSYLCQLGGKNLCASWKKKVGLLLCICNLVHTCMHDTTYPRNGRVF